MRSFRQAFQIHPSNPLPSIRPFSSSSTLSEAPPDPLHASSPPPNPHLQPNPLSLKPPKPNNAHFPKPPNTLAANRLADSCFKSGSFDKALQVLTRMPHPDPTSLTLMISCYNRMSRYDNSLRTFNKLRSSGMVLSQSTFGHVVSACTEAQEVQFGMQLCSLVLKNGLLCSDGYVVSGLIDLFSKNGRFDDALRVFWESQSSNVVCWNAMIAGGVRNGENLVALDLFCRMVEGHCMPTGFTFSSVLSACAAAGDLELGRGVHGWVLKCDVKDDVFVGTSIVDLYAKCGDMDAAAKEFSRMPVRNVVSWTAVISGFVQREEGCTALNFFREMIQAAVEINKYTLTSVLLACSKSSMAKETFQIHCLTLKNGLFMDSVVKDALISTYANIGYVQMSENIFEESAMVRSPGTWSAMISVLAQNQSLRRSIELLKKMFSEGLKPDNKCFSSVLSNVTCIDFGQQLHSYAVKAGGLVFDLLVGSALFTMYSKCGHVNQSYGIFSQMQDRDRVSWTSMISGFAVHGHANKAFKLFREMVHGGTKPDQVTLCAVLMACNGHKFLMKGKEIHGHALRDGLSNDTFVASAVVSMYFKCRAVACARRVFNGVPGKDQVMWSSLISGYSSNDHNEEALSEFHRMAFAGFELDHITSSSVLGMCGNLLRPVLGRQLHAHGLKAGIMSQNAMSSALLTMYSKCGSIDESRKVFDETENHDLVSWTAMIDGYAQHGRGFEALQIFELMKKGGIKPDSVTFVSVLSACSHNGLVEEGFLHFNSMRSDYGIEPAAHHYACIVDLLCRLGRLKEAEEFINKMPIEPDFLVWSTLLSACRVHGDVKLGKLAAKKVFERQPHDSGTYVSLSNISADTGNWEEVMSIRSSMTGTSMKKEPGWSII